MIVPLLTNGDNGIGFGRAIQRWLGIIGQLTVGQQRASRLIVDDRGNRWHGGRQRVDQLRRMALLPG